MSVPNCVIVELGLYFFNFDLKRLVGWLYSLYCSMYGDCSSTYVFRVLVIQIRTVLTSSNCGTVAHGLLTKL